MTRGAESVPQSNAGERNPRWGGRFAVGGSNREVLGLSGAFSPGELLELPFVNIGHPFPAGLGRCADSRIVEGTSVTQGEHVGTIPCYPRPKLIGVTDGAVTGDKEIDLARDILKQL